MTNLIKKEAKEIKQLSKGGRPTKYNAKILEKSIEYLQNCIDEYEEFHKTRGEKSDTYERINKINFPSIEGLARYLNLNTETLQEWNKRHPEFSVFIRQLKDEQVKRLVNGGLSGQYSPVITKLLLSKHGYSESQDINVNVNQITGFNFLPPIEVESIDITDSQVEKDKDTED